MNLDIYRFFFFSQLIKKISYKWRSLIPLLFSIDFFFLHQIDLERHEGQVVNNDFIMRGELSL